MTDNIKIYNTITGEERIVELKSPPLIYKKRVVEACLGLEGLGALEKIGLDLDQFDKMYDLFDQAVNSMIRLWRLNPDNWSWDFIKER